MLIGICGKPNVGKSSMFAAATMLDVPISNRIFTTVHPNVGVGYARKPCVCSELNVQCQPVNSLCIRGNRFIPIKLVDIAGLVPDAHKGKGLGNQFLSDIVEADALIQVVDISGATDSSGNPDGDDHDPGEDVTMIEREMNFWIAGIIQKAVGKMARMEKEDAIEALYTQVSGLNIKKESFQELLKEGELSSQPTEDEVVAFADRIRRKTKPHVIAGNKADKVSLETVDEMKKRLACIPCSAQAELALRKAAGKNIIAYLPGDAKFSINAADEAQQRALDYIQKNVFEKIGSTGVQNVINTAVFDLLGMIAVYPVENEHKLTNKNGSVLPDIFLVKKGTTARELAFKIHEDIGKRFIAAVDARTKKTLAATYVLKDNDIVSIRYQKG